MRSLRFGLAVVGVILCVACGRAVGSGVDDGGGPVDGTADAGSAPDAAVPMDGGTPVTPTDLLGPWVDMQIGDCIDYEIWLHFDALGAATFIAGDFDACMDPADHCRIDRQGTYWTEPGGVLGFEWSAPEGTVISRRSSSVVDLAGPGAPEPELHLSLFTYWRTAGSWHWQAHRQSDVEVAPDTPEQHFVRVTTDTEVALDGDPRTLAPGELASMEVTLRYEVAPLDGGPVTAGEEGFTFDAELEALGWPGWPSLTATLDGQDVHYQWWWLLEARGVMSQLPAEAAVRVTDAFQGYLLVDATDAGQLIPYPYYGSSPCLRHAESFNPRPAPACAEPIPFGVGLP